MFIVFYIVNMYLWHVPHPTVFMTRLWIHGFYVYIYVFMYV